MLSVFIMTALTYTHFKLSIGQITGPSLSHLRNRGLSPVPRLSFEIYFFVESEEWRLAPPFRVGNMTMVVNSALAFVGN